jgi:hypothetical protein
MLYYMLCRTSDDAILDYETTDSFSSAVSNSVVRSKELANVPKLGATLTAGGTYTEPVDAYVKCDWSGDGVIVGDTYEIVADGVKTATLTLKKWDRNANVAILEAGDSFWVGVIGVSFSPSAGKVTLDDNGEAVVTFTPQATEKGLGTIQFSPLTGTNSRANTAMLAAI